MSDLHTFYRDTEPWIAAAAVPSTATRTATQNCSKRSRRCVLSTIDVPLLVVHGEQDTNVPIGEAQQIVAA